MAVSTGPIAKLGATPKRMRTKTRTPSATHSGPRASGRFWKCGSCLSKSSLYETFGSKHELYLSALDHYIRTVHAKQIGAVIAAHASARPNSPGSGCGRLSGASTPTRPSSS